MSYLPFPFFLATATALAKRYGIEGFIRDSVALGESYDDFYAHVGSVAPDVLVVETSTPTLENDLMVVRAIRSRMPEIMIVLCGIHFELEHELFLRNHPEIDCTVYGEYERPVAELLRAKSERKELRCVPNLVYRENGSIRKTSSGPLIAYSELPWPDRDSLPVETYFDGVCGLEAPQMQMLTTRGCPYGCIFCVWPQLVYRGRSYRLRSPEDVADEIEANLKKVDYRSVYMDDDTFNVQSDHVYGVARVMKARGLDRLKWSIMARADLMSEDMLVTLKEAGLHSVKYGVESASQSVLNEIGKRLDLDKVASTVELTKKLGIRVHLTFTFGLPSDTRKTIEDTIQLACTLPSDSVQFSIATPFPGTKMFSLYESKGWIRTTEWSQYDGAAKAVSRTNTLSGDELESYVEEGYCRYSRTQVERRLREPEFRNSLVERLRKALSAPSKLVVLQSGNIAFTTGLVRLLGEFGHEVHVITHERFAARLSDVLASARIHVFDNPVDFSFDELEGFVRNVDERESFAGAVVVYSKSSGSGYEQVERLACATARRIVAGVTIFGDIIR